MDGSIADVFVIFLLWGLQLTLLKEINCTELEYLIPTLTTVSPPDSALIAQLKWQLYSFRIMHCSAKYLI